MSYGRRPVRGQADASIIIIFTLSILNGRLNRPKVAWISIFLFQGEKKTQTISSTKQRQEHEQLFRPIQLPLTLHSIRYFRTQFPLRSIKIWRHNLKKVKLRASVLIKIPFWREKRNRFKITTDFCNKESAVIYQGEFGVFWNARSKDFLSLASYTIRALYLGIILFQSESASSNKS